MNSNLKHEKIDGSSIRLIEVTAFKVKINYYSSVMFSRHIYFFQDRWPAEKVKTGQYLVSFLGDSNVANQMTTEFTQTYH